VAGGPAVSGPDVVVPEDESSAHPATDNAPKANDRVNNKESDLIEFSGDVVVNEQCGGSRSSSNERLPAEVREAFPHQCS